MFAVYYALYSVAYFIRPLLLCRRGLGLVFGWVMCASIGSAHSGLRPPAFFLIPSMRWALALVPKGPWTYMWLGHAGSRWVWFQRPSAAGSLFNTPNEMGPCSCAEGALDLCLVASCGLLFGCLTAAFGRRLSFSIPSNDSGPCSCTEEALGLYLFASCCACACAATSPHAQQAETRQG